MNIEQQFNLIAQEYDVNRRKFITCFDDFYCRTTDFITDGILQPNTVLDLGAGTGLLTYYWYKAFPNANFTLVDLAADMLKVAEKRFDGLQNFDYCVSDYLEQYPTEKFDAVISALSIHHLENLDKEKLFGKVYNSLNDGGVFVNYDQFCADSEQMSEKYNRYWENELENGGLSSRDIQLWHERRTLDKECSVLQEIEMMKRSGFSSVQCVYSCRKFAVIMGTK